MYEAVSSHAEDDQRSEAGTLKNTHSKPATPIQADRKVKLSCPSRIKHESYASEKRESVGPAEEPPQPEVEEKPELSIGSAKHEEELVEGEKHEEQAHERERHEEE